MAQTTLEESIHEEDLLRDLVISLVEDKDEVEITSYPGPEGFKNLVVHCAKEDRGRVIGKDGCNIEALRAYFRSYATFNGLGKLYLHLEKLEG